MNTDRPLEQVTSIKVKLAVLVGSAVIVAALVMAIGRQAGVPIWASLPVTLAVALGVTNWLARGLTVPLREMTEAAGRVAAGDYTARVVVTSNDEVGALARAFSAMATDLAGVDRQRRQLVATVSHELRTPLAAQRAVLENLADGVTAPDEATLRTALAQSERLSDLVADLLDLSRIDGGQRTLQVAPVRVGDLLGAAAEEARLTRSDLAIEVSVTPGDLTVEVDPARFHQVVANLLDNAIRHSPESGAIRLAAAAASAGERWTLDVTDDGPGLTPEQAERGFRHFGAGADQTSGASGLGLAIAGWVVELHGGTIRALPAADGQPGATVRIDLPTHQPAPTPIVPAPAALTPAALTPAALTPTAPTPTAPTPTAPTPTVLTAQELAPMTTPPSPTAPATVPAPATVAQPPAYRPVETKPFMDQMFGRLWPERDSRPQPKLVGGALLVGVLAAILLPDHNMGLATLIVLALGAGLMFSASARKRSPMVLGAAALAAALGLVIVLRATPQLQVLAIVVSAVVVAVALVDARTITGIIGTGVSWVLSGIRGLPLLGRTISDTSRNRLLWPILRTAALSLVVLVIFGSLFSSADAVFGSWASALVPDLAWNSLIFRIFVACFTGGVVLAGTYLSLNPPNTDLMALPPGTPARRPWEWQVPVGLVGLTYVGFLAAQGAAFFGGHDYVQRTTGLTYAEYVHQGFGQLTVATVLTLAVIGLMWRKASVETARDRLALRIAVIALCLLTLLVVASALHRMALYQEAYGYTMLRVFVDLFEGWLGFVVLCVLVAGLRLDRRWVVRAALISGAVLALAYGLANPAARVAEANIARYAETGKLDFTYLTTLGPDAAPVIDSSTALDAHTKACLLYPARHVESDDVLGWNLGLSRAADIYARVAQGDAPTNCPVDSTR